MTQPDGDRLAALVAEEGALLVGVGHPLCGDDAVGSLIAARLAPRFPGRVIDAGSVPENYFGPLAAVEGRPVVFLDAAAGPAEPGSWCLAGADALVGRSPDTHRASLRLLAELLAERAIPTWIVGIAPASLLPGAPLTPPVARAADDLVALLTAALVEAPVHV